MARSVRDLVLLDSIITGQRTPLQPAALKGLRIGIPRGYFFDGLGASLGPVIEKALTTLRDAGCVLIEADMPNLEKLYVAATGPITYYEMLHDLARYLRESRLTLTVQELVAQIARPDVKPLYETSVIGPQAPTRAAYDAAMRQSRPALQSAYREYFRTNHVAVIAFPTTILPARPTGDDVEVESNGKRVPTFGAHLHDTRPIALAGIPGLSLPVGQTVTGLPVGMELDAPEGADRQLLSTALAVESLFGPLPPPS